MSKLNDENTVCTGASASHISAKWSALFAPRLTNSCLRFFCNNTGVSSVSPPLTLALLNSSPRLPKLVILRKLSIFFPAFYALFYIVGIIFIGGFGLPWKHLARIPFYFQWDDFRPAYRRQPLPDRELPLGAAAPAGERPVRVTAAALHAPRPVRLTHCLRRPRSGVALLLLHLPSDDDAHLHDREVDADGACPPGPRCALTASSCPDATADSRASSPPPPPSSGSPGTTPSPSRSGTGSSPA